MGVMNRVQYGRYGSSVGPGPGVAPDTGVSASAAFAAGGYGSQVGGQASATATGILLLVLVGIVFLSGWKGV